MKRAGGESAGRMGVAVYGLIRSGTTLVSDLLTVRDRSLVISEPDLFVPWDERVVRRIHATARNFGLPVPAEPPAQARYGTFARYFEQELMPVLGTLDCWGIKQVQFLFWRELFNILQPARLVLCVRDIREVVLSAFDLIGRMGLTFGAKPVLRDEAWVLTRLCHDIHELVAMMQVPHLLLRYEDLVTEPDLRDRLADYVSLNALGSERLNLEGEPDSRSAWESARHGGQISVASLGRYSDEPPGPARSLAERVWAILPGYADRFGYELPDETVRVRRHSLAGSGTGAVNPVSQSMLGWGAGKPPEFEPAFARRHARVAAARMIEPGSVVLDLACVVPALRLMLPPGCRYIASDVKERFDGCVVADYRNGDLPPCDGVDVITVLGLLETLDQPLHLLRRLRLTGARVILAYHAADDMKDIDCAALGWGALLTRRALREMLDQSGFECEPQWAFDGRQSLLILTPRAV
ncbi:MAG TPA: hypothetical protein ENK05_10085 [Gammaproteobacteria bacterium]|nr:hypothetical protein [Gammaproteobacteria bacterium]